MIINNGILLYIDPGTGSMLFTILLGVVGTGTFFIKKIWLKLKFRINGGKADVSNSHIQYLIFSEGRSYWNTFKSVCDELEKRGVDSAYWTADRDDPALKENYAHIDTVFIGEGNKAYAKLNMASADICLATTPGLDVYQWKRSKNIKYYIHILHETGGSLQYKMFGLDFFDAVLLTGSFQADEIRALEKARNIKNKDLAVVGCPYMDSLKKRFDTSKAPSNDGKVILLAPSWGTNGILSLYGVKIMEALKATGYRIVIRPHPQSIKSEKDMIERLMKAYPNDDTISWNFDSDNFDVLQRADVLISDFSGVMFDYALVFDKPVIYAGHKFERDEYDIAWLDDWKLWKEEILPYIGIPIDEDQFSDFKAIIDDLSDNEKFAVGREKARKEAWAHIGHSAELVADFLISKGAELSAG